MSPVRAEASASGANSPSSMARSARARREALRRLAAPIYAETAALYGEPAPDALARRADRVDLIVGGANRGTAPYGTSFDDVARRVPAAEVHELPRQGHMAHLQAPAELARLLEGLAAAG